jgi:HAD superfamily hydrolase (TIGR01509 family)
VTPARIDRALSLPAALDTLFLDVGNTLISMDFEWIADELAGLGVSVRAEDVRRAEAAARPETSRGLRNHTEHRASELFRFRFGVLLGHLQGSSSNPSPSERAGILDGLEAALHRPAAGRPLWSSVMPGVPAALERFRAMGLRLAVVSNADGRIDEILRKTGLRDYFDVVIDSHHVGFEKPDPRIFELALERSGAERSRTVHVGDLYDADVQGARRADVGALLLDPYDDWADVDCDRLPDLTALARVLDERSR